MPRRPDPIAETIDKEAIEIQSALLAESAGDTEEETPKSVPPESVSDEQGEDGHGPEEHGPLWTVLTGKSSSLGTYAEKLEAAGYTGLKLLGDDQKKAEAAIKNVCPDIPGGYLAQILEAWKEATKTPKAGDPVPAPKLKPGSVLDLTQPTLKFDDVSFEIPKGIPAAKNGRDVRTASSLSAVEWLTIARNNRLLYGLDLEDVLAGGQYGFVDHAALVWTVPENDDFFRTVDDSYSSSSVCYSSRMESLTKANVINASLSVSLPFVGATAEAQRDERHASLSVHKTLRMRGGWNYPRARINLEYCTAPSPRLIAELRIAMSLGTEEKKFARLTEILKKYGHVVPKHLLLGGQMFFDKLQEVQGSVDSETVKTTVQTAVDIKTSQGGGGASVGFADGHGNNVEAQTLSQEVSWRTIGGDTTLDGSPSEWRDSVKDPNLWRIIARDGLVSIVDRIGEVDPDLQTQVLKVWEAGLKSLWSGHAPPEGYVFPPLGGKPFTISHGTSTTAQVYKSYVGPVWGDYEVETVTDGMADPLARNCLWQLVYTGRTKERAFIHPFVGVESIRDDLPLFWIVGYSPLTAKSMAAGHLLGAVVPYVLYDYRPQHGESYPRMKGWDPAMAVPPGKDPEHDKLCFWIDRPESWDGDPNKYYVHATGAILAPPGNLRIEELYYPTLIPYPRS